MHWQHAVLENQLWCILRMDHDAIISGAQNANQASVEATNPYRVSEIAVGEPVPVKRTKK